MSSLPLTVAELEARFDEALDPVLSSRRTAAPLAKALANVERSQQDFGNLQHIYEGFTKGRADAALAASIFHFKEYTIRQAKEYLKERGVPVRL